MKDVISLEMQALKAELAHKTDYLRELQQEKEKLLERIHEITTRIEELSS